VYDTTRTTYELNIKKNVEKYILKLKYDIFFIFFYRDANARDVIAWTYYYLNRKTIPTFAQLGVTITKRSSWIILYIQVYISSDRRKKYAINHFNYFNSERRNGRTYIFFSENTLRSTIKVFRTFRTVTLLFGKANLKSISAVKREIIVKNKKMIITVYAETIGDKIKKKLFRTFWKMFLF